LNDIDNVPVPDSPATFGSADVLPGRFLGPVPKKLSPSQARVRTETRRRQPSHFRRPHAQPVTWHRRRGDDVITARQARAVGLAGLPARGRRRQNAAICGQRGEEERARQPTSRHRRLSLYDRMFTAWKWKITPRVQAGSGHEQNDRMKFYS